MFCRRLLHHLPSIQGTLLQLSPCRVLTQGHYYCTLSSDSQQSSAAGTPGARPDIVKWQPRPPSWRSRKSAANLVLPGVVKKPAEGLAADGLARLVETLLAEDAPPLDDWSRGSLARRLDAAAADPLLDDVSAVHLLNLFSTLRLPLADATVATLLEWLWTSSERLETDALFDALHFLGRLPTADPSPRLLSRLVVCVLRRLHDASPDQLVYSVWAFNRKPATYHPDCQGVLSALWVEWFEASLPALSRMSPKALSLAVFSVARQQRVAPAAWSNRLLSCLRRSAADVDMTAASIGLRAIAQLYQQGGDSFYDEDIVRQMCVQWHGALDTMPLETFTNGLLSVCHLPVSVQSIAPSFWADVARAANRLVTPETFSFHMVKLIFAIRQKTHFMNAVPWSLVSAALHPDALARVDAANTALLLNVFGKYGVAVPLNSLNLMVNGLCAASAELNCRYVLRWASGLTHLGHPLDARLWRLCQRHLPQATHSDVGAFLHTMLVQTVALQQPLHRQCLTDTLGVCSEMDELSPTLSAILQRLYLWLGADEAASFMPESLLQRIRSPGWLPRLRAQMHDDRRLESGFTDADKLRTALLKIYPRVQRQAAVAEAATNVQVLVDGLAGERRLAILFERPHFNFVGVDGRPTRQRRPASFLPLNLLAKAGYTTELLSLHEWRSQPNQVLEYLRDNYPPML